MAHPWSSETSADEGPHHPWDGDDDSHSEGADALDGVADAAEDEFIDFAVRLLLERTLTANGLR